MNHLNRICVLLVAQLFTNLSYAQDVTSMLKDIVPGANSSSAGYFAVLNGIMYFDATDGVNGYELWKSDGTPSGTVMLKDINPGPNNSTPNEPAIFNGILYFSATDGVNGFELWKSDGTPSGTFMIKDMNPGAGFSNPTQLTVINNAMFFNATDGSDGAELWRSDGTASGTYMIKDIYPGAGQSAPNWLTTVNGTLFFQAMDGTNGYELWKSDGTYSGTVMVKDINPGANGSDPAYLTNVNGTLFFRANDGTNGNELWKSDGTPTGTVMVKDINPGATGSYSASYINMNGMLYFQATDGTNGYELWKSDGTTPGTVIVKDIYPGSGTSFPMNLINVNGILYFEATNGTNGYELWKSDGTASGTVMVKDIFPGASSSNPGSLTNFNGTLFFQAIDGTNGYELWKSDGSSSGTVMVKDINPGGNSSTPAYLTNVDGTLYFRATDGIHGNELWKYYTKDQVGKILNVSDVPNDQGSKVRLTWTKSAWDTTDGSGNVLSYSIWRKIPPALLAAGYTKSQLALGLSVLDDSLSQYDYLQTVPAMRIPSYSVVVPTLEDSSANGIHSETFLLTANTSDPNYYYVSSSKSGHSVDNLAPIRPAGLVATTHSGPQSQLTWISPTDPDVGYYDVYRSTAANFTPAPGLKIGTSYSTVYTDDTPVIGMAYHYRIIAVDVHGNQSQPSSEATAAFPITQTFAVNNGWDLVSLALIPSDFTKTILYPTAISEAFAFEGAYVVSPALQNGVGYWLRFSGNQNIPITGTINPDDTIDVTEGWNLIGSMSLAVPVISVGSIPGGLVTSQFFGYNGGYTTVTSIQPGGGYWVKVNGTGKLILNSMTSTNSRISIRPISEQPPLPPDGDNGALPKVFSLQQNYPNPFNPTTTINYTLPNSVQVKLSVFNILGQEVAVLVNEYQDAGYKSLAFNANNLSSGMYTYKLSAGTFTDIKKMIVIK